MRRRLVTAFVGISVALVLVYGASRFFFLTSLVESTEQNRVDRSAELVAAYLDDAVADHEAVTSSTLEELVGPDERLTYTAPGGTEVSVPPREWPDSAAVATRDLADGGTLTLTLSSDVVDSAVRDAVAPLIYLALLVIALAAVAGWVLARRLATPFDELADLAEGLGRGRLDQTVPRYRVPEADAIGRALEESSRRLRRMMRRERDVAVYASHELRTPITALRLTLEDLALWRETQPAVAAELNRIIGEVDRFSAAVTSLLDESHDEMLHRAQHFDLAEVVTECVRSVEPAARGRGTRISVEAEAPLPVTLPRVAVVRALDLLLERATFEAAGPVVVRLSREPSHDAVTVAYASTAGGPTVALEASEIVSALGGRLVNEGGKVPRLVLMLPREDVVAGL